MSYPRTSTYLPSPEIVDSEVGGYKVPVVVAAGQVLVKGTVMGKVTTGGQWKAYASGSSDGSQVPWGILAQNVDSTNNGSNPVPASMYVKGTFVTANLTGLDSNALSVRTTWLSNTALGLLLL